MLIELNCFLPRNDIFRQFAYEKNLLSFLFRPIAFLKNRLRAVPPYISKGGTADNISRNDIRVVHTLQNSNWLI